MTPDFDPARVDWNNPDVEYLMKHFKTAMTNWNDEIAALTRSSEELRTSNEELRGTYSELEAKYKDLVRMYSQIAGRDGAADPDAPPGPGDRQGKEPARRRNYTAEYNFVNNRQI